MKDVEVALALELEQALSLDESIEAEAEIGVSMGSELPQIRKAQENING